MTCPPAPGRGRRIRSCSPKRELGRRRGADVGFYANTGRTSAHSGTSARCRNRTSSGASDVQKRGYGKPPLKHLIRPQEYCGTGTGAKDVRKSVEAVEKLYSGARDATLIRQTVETRKKDSSCHPPRFQYCVADLGRRVLQQPQCVSVPCHRHRF